MLGDSEALALIENASRRGAFLAHHVASLAPDILFVARRVASAIENGGKILVLGNGGSAAAAQHFAGEFSGKLKMPRKPFPAISLSADSVALTAIANDFGFEEVFSRQVEALCSQEDIVFALSTSGKSPNIIEGIAAARKLGAFTCSLVGGEDELEADFSLGVPSIETARIQEVHDLILHQIAQISERFLIPLENDSSANPFSFVLADPDIKPFKSWLSATGQKLVTTGGVFDLFHSGHRALLSAARNLGDYLVVALNSDDGVRRLKGPTRPVQTLDQRISALRSFSAVDHVVVFDQDNPTELIEKLGPAVHVKGGDYLGKYLPEGEVVLKNGGYIEIVPLVEGVSTSTILGGA